MSTIDSLAKKLAKTLIDAQSKKPTSYDTQAEVRRVEGDTAWVHIPGGVDETPVQLTTNAKKGDIVQVRVSGGRAWLYGNQTNPPTDDTRANEANKVAVSANEHAINAVTEAGIAKEAADSAQASAAIAKAVTDEIEGYAQTVSKTVTQVLEDGETAGVAAQQASESASSAYNSASKAINQLSIVENIVGVLDMIANHGTYSRTIDEEPQQDKWYFLYDSNTNSYEVQTNVDFQYLLTSDQSIVIDKPYYTRSGSGTEEDPYVYTQVNDPVVTDIGTYYENTRWNYYELTDIDQSIQNFVSSHLALSNVTGNLMLQHGNGTRLELSTTDGVILYDQNGSEVARYGTDTIIGNLNNFGIKIGESPDSTSQNLIYELGFYQDGKRVAYINNNSLYITQTVVLKQMKMGDNLGVWAWCIHEISGKNNLYLKWLG